MSDDTTSTVVAPTPSWFARLVTAAANLYHRFVTADENFLAVEASHPEIVAIANTLKSELPANVQSGINVAETLATSVNNILTHANEVGVAPAPITASIKNLGTVAMIALMLLGASLGLSACQGFVAPTSAAAVTTDLTQAKADLQTATTVYGINKGLANVALPLLPVNVQAIVTNAEVTGDQLLTMAQTTLADASVTATAVEAVVAQLQAQANTLAVQAAGVVKVVPAQS